MFYYPFAAFFNAIHKSSMIEYEVSHVPEEHKEQVTIVRNVNMIPRLGGKSRRI